MISKGNPECLNAILIHGIGITPETLEGEICFHLATKCGQVSRLQILLQDNCPVEPMALHGRTVLHDATTVDCPSSIQLPCDHGDSVNTKDIDEWTPLALGT